jgi:large subunit ribosomal protein L9
VSQDTAAAKLTAQAQEQARAIEALHFTQARQASDEGRLFGSIGKADLVAYLAQHGVEVERRRIALDEPIKSVGDFTVPIRLHADVTGQLKVSVTRE